MEFPKQIVAECLQIILSMLHFSDAIIFTTKVSKFLFHTYSPINDSQVIIWMRYKPSKYILDSWLYVLPVSVCQKLYELYNCHQIVAESGFWYRMVELASSTTKLPCSFYSKLLWIANKIFCHNGCCYSRFFCKLVTKEVLFLDGNNNSNPDFNKLLSLVLQNMWISKKLFDKLLVRFHSNLDCMTILLSQNIEKAKFKLTHKQLFDILLSACKSSCNSFPFLQFFLEKYNSQIPVVRFSKKKLELCLLQTCCGGDLATFRWFMRIAHEKHIEFSQVFYQNVCKTALEHFHFPILHYNKTMRQITLIVVKTSFAITFPYCYDSFEIILSDALGTNDIKTLTTVISILRISKKHIWPKLMRCSTIHHISLQMLNHVVTNYVLFFNKLTQKKLWKASQKQLIELLQQTCFININYNFVKWLLSTIDQVFLQYVIHVKKKVIIEKDVIEYLYHRGKVQMLQLLKDHNLLFFSSKKTTSQDEMQNFFFLTQHQTYTQSLSIISFIPTIVTDLSMNVCLREFTKFRIQNKEIQNIWWNLTIRTNNQLREVEPTNSKLQDMIVCADTNPTFRCTVLFLHFVLFEFVSKNPQFTDYIQKIVKLWAKSNFKEKSLWRSNIILISKMEDICYLLFPTRE